MSDDAHPRRAVLLRWLGKLLSKSFSGFWKGAFIVGGVASSTAAAAAPTTLGAFPGWHVIFDGGLWGAGVYAAIFIESNPLPNLFDLAAEVSAKTSDEISTS